MNSTTNFDELVERYLDGELTPADAERLVALLASDRSAASAFAKIARHDFLLERTLETRRQEDDAVRMRERMDANYQIARQRRVESANGSATNGLVQLASKPQQKYNQSAWPVVLAASLLVATAATLLYSQSGANSVRSRPIAAMAPASADSVAMLRRTKDISWGQRGALENGARLKQGELIKFDSGIVEIAYDSGTVAVLKGPAEAVLRSPRLLEIYRGTVTANVAEGDTGFRVETPSATVVDLSTAFGVSVSDAAETNVVVFDGGVDVHLDAERQVKHTLPNTVSGDASLRHMTAGDGVLIDPRGKVSRLVAFNSEAFPTSHTFEAERSGRKPLIASVRDSLNDEQTSKSYQIVSGGLREDAAAYVDRVYQWNGVTKVGMPEFLLNADYVMMFNDDKYSNKLEVEVALDAPAVLYVFIDQRVALPDWLTRDFQDTGYIIGLDEVVYPRRGKELPPLGPGVSINSVFSVWRREIPHAMTVRMGAQDVLPGKKLLATAMYGVAAVPLGADRDFLGKAPAIEFEHGK